MTLIVTTLKCSLPRVEMIEESICQRIIRKLRLNAICALVPMLPMPIESYILASFIAYKSRHKRIARKYSLDILTRLLAHRQISDIISIVRDPKFSEKGYYLLVLYIDNAIDVDNLHRQFRDLILDTSCSLTDIPKYPSDAHQIVTKYIHMLHDDIPEERIEPLMLISIAGCSMTLV